MYEALAMAIEMNHGSPADTKTSLNYAADLAQKTHNPNFLVSVADQMYMKGLFRSGWPVTRRGRGEGPAPVEPLSHVHQPGARPRTRADGGFHRPVALARLAGRGRYFRESRNQAETLAKTLP